MLFLFLLFCHLPSILHAWNCTHHTSQGYDAGNLDHYYIHKDVDLLVDSDHKIVMGWTPKAACTKSVIMFFDHMNIIYGRDYTVWPHDYRKVYYQKCGRASPDTFESADWYRFKVVRNPFIRAVSSYYHVAPRIGLLLQHTNAPTPPGNMSFADFVGFMERVNVRHLYEIGRHISFQHRHYELNATTKAFHRIVKVEELDDAVVPLNADIRNHPGGLGRPFISNATYTGKTDHVDKVNVTAFIGRDSWYSVRSMHPMNYGVMYDEDLRKRVEKIYAIDLKLYNYSWPF